MAKSKLGYLEIHFSSLTETLNVGSERKMLALFHHDIGFTNNIWFTLPRSKKKKRNRVNVVPMRCKIFILVTKFDLEVILTLYFYKWFDGPREVLEYLSSTYSKKDQHSLEYTHFVAMQTELEICKHSSLQWTEQSSVSYNTKYLPKYIFKHRSILKIDII